MSVGFIPGKGEPEETIDVTRFINPPRYYVARWWMKPICWPLRRPTSYIA